MKPEAVSSAVSSDTLDISLIDFSAFLDGDEQTKRSTAQAVLSGFQQAGFIYLRNHGILKPIVQKTFAQSAKFFKRPIEQKDQLAWSSAASNRGYVTQGREKVTDILDANDVEKLREQEGQDLKESFEIGREGEADHPNHWPDGFDAEGKEFKSQMMDFFDQCKKLHMQVMRAIAVGLDIEEGWFDSYTDDGDNTLRLLHYPQVEVEVFKKNKLQVRAGAHTDYG
jgi:isopenicillin N synthase-like dioxygenase